MANFQPPYQPTFYLAVIAMFLAFIVIMLGAYTRLKDAGLGCPDWPGCYGQLHVPQTSQQLAQAAQAYPNLPVEAPKAWAEMIHRYIAGALGLVIFSLVIILFRRREQSETPSLTIPYLLIAVVIFQALLGKWTVTMLLYPPVVMGHLLGGLTLLSLLGCLSLKLSGTFATDDKQRLQKYRLFALVALIIVALQIALGGWTSANYAGPSCPDFPYCQEQLFPDMSLQKGFNLLMPIGANFQGGLLDNAARVAIHFTHRFGALITFFVIDLLAIFILVTSKDIRLRGIALILLVFLIAQISLGVLLVVLHFPLAVAVTHNGMAALLLLSIVILNCYLYPPRNISQQK